MPTPDLFAFDAERLAMYEEGRVRDALTEHPALYVNHLEIAQHLFAVGGSAGNRREANPGPEYTKGYVTSSS